MMPYGSLADDFYANLTLTTEMPLAGNRESVLHYVEQMQKRFTDLASFYARGKHDYVIEGDKESGSYRWAAVDPRRVSAGHINPPRLKDAVALHQHVLEIAPYALSISRLDCEAIDFMVGFDFTYRGNHNQLVAEALGLPPAFEKLAGPLRSRLIHHEPSLTFAVDDDCRMQCRVGVETRTSPQHVRTGDFPDEQLSVYVTTRRYGSLDPQLGFAGTYDQLVKVSRDVIETYVVDSVLEPLAKTIAMH